MIIIVGSELDISEYKSLGLEVTAMHPTLFKLTAKKLTNSTGALRILVNRTESTVAILESIPEHILEVTTLCDTDEELAQLLEGIITEGINTAVPSDFQVSGHIESTGVDGAEAGVESNLDDDQFLADPWGAATEATVDSEGGSLSDLEEDPVLKQLGLGTDIAIAESEEISLEGLPDLTNFDIDSEDFEVAQLRSRNSELEDTLNLMAAEFEKTVSEHTLELKRIQEDNAVALQKLMAAAESASNEASHPALAKVISFFEKPRTKYIDKFTAESVESISFNQSRVMALLSGTGESYYGMMSQILNLIKSDANVAIIDFSNDSYLAEMLRLSKTDTTLDLILGKDITADSLCTPSGCMHTKVFVSSTFQTLCLLNADWIDILNKVNAVAGDRPIILLFDGIKDHCVRHAFSMVAQLVKTYLFVKCSPTTLLSTYNNSAFCMDPAVTPIVALDYLPAVKATLDAMSKGGKRRVIAFKDAVVFGDLFAELSN